MNSNRYKGIDIIKFFCVFLVIVIHVAPFGVNGAGMLNYVFQKILARISVPFFFTTSGFLLFRRFDPNSIQKDGVSRFLKNIFRLYVVWTVIYSPFILHAILTEKAGILMGIVLALRDFLLTGSYTHLWYLNSLFFSVIFICFLVKHKNNIRVILGISFFLFLIGLLGQTYFGLLAHLRTYTTIWSALKLTQTIMVTTRNAIFEGFFFVSLGAYFAWNREKLTKGFNSIVLPVISIAVLLLEGILIKSYGHPLQWNTYFFSAVAVFFLFRYAIDQEKSWPFSEATCKWFRDIVELVYFLHLWVRAVVDIMMGKMLPTLQNTPLRYLIVCIISLILGQLILVLSKKERLKFLRILI